MMVTTGWGAAGLALAITAGLTPVLRRWLLAQRILDWPGSRSSHAQPTPRGGGLAILAGFLVALLVFAGTGRGVLVPLGYGLVLAALGWLDDRAALPVRTRLLVMLVGALVLVGHFGPVSELELFGRVVVQPWLWSLLAVVAVIWLINLHNFMDGSDGLAALQGAWSGLLLGNLLYRGGAELIGLLGFALAGACLGFLFWNRPPARLFMGDTGSLLIGGMIACLAYAGAAQGIVSIWISFMICALFVVDATATLVARLVSGGQWYTPHREHAYQRLIRAGWSHARVLLVYGLINLALVLPLVAMALFSPPWEMPLALLLAALLCGGWFIVQRCTPREEPTA